MRPSDLGPAGGDVRTHRILGTTAEFLENALSMTMEAEVVGDSVEVEVAITNDQTGHHVPTGVTIRNMILLVEASQASDGEPLEHTGSTVIHDLAVCCAAECIADPDQGYYAGLPAVVREDQPCSHRFHPKKRAALRRSSPTPWRSWTTTAAPHWPPTRATTRSHSQRRAATSRSAPASSTGALGAHSSTVKTGTTTGTATPSKTSPHRTSATSWPPPKRPCPMGPRCLTAASPMAVRPTAEHPTVEPTTAAAAAAA